MNVQDLNDNMVCPDTINDPITLLFKKAGTISNALNILYSSTVKH